MPNTVIALKKSATPTAAPTNLANGELAINYADGILYYKAANGTIASIQSLEGNSFGTVNANGTLIVSDTVGDFLTMVSGNNISIVGDAINDRITIQLADDVVIPRTGTFKVSAVGNDEGGEIKLGNAITNSVLAGDIIIDVFQNRLRFFESGSPNRGAFINLASATTGVGSDLLAAASGTDISARLVSNAAFLHANAAFDKANAALPNVSGASFNGNLTVSQNLTSDRVFTNNNGNGENLRVGDDVWIGDTNLANALRIKGQQNASIGYVMFGTNDGKLLGRAGTGPLTYDGNTVWHSGNDGLGSGLDADTLDGQSGSYYGIASDVTAVFARANIIFANANTVMISAQSAFTQANIAYAHANTAHASANAGQATGNAAFVQANTATALATAAQSIANLAFIHANNAFATVNSAFGVANAALPNTSGVTFNGTLNASQNLSADKIIATNNGNGENFRVGDDAWIGDFNVSNTIKIKGVQNNQIAYISFGTGDSKALGRIGTGSLTYDGNIVWHQGNDGSGSGLDADLLDGQNGTYYGKADDVTATFAHANAAFAKANAANVLADGKLSLTGGTLTGPVVLNDPQFEVDTFIPGQASLGYILNSGSYGLSTPNTDVYLSLYHASGSSVTAGPSSAAISSINSSVSVTSSGINYASGYELSPVTIVSSGKQWIFSSNGHIVFPDSTRQYTAFSNSYIATFNAAFSRANTANITADRAWNHANAAFANANTVMVSAQAAFTVANSSFLHANAAFASANAGQASANAGQSTANAAFARANTANITADRAWNHANAAFITANIAFANANTVMISAQAAFTVANSSFLHANAAFDVANTSGIEAEFAFLRANLAHAHANAAFLSSNSVNTYSDATYVKLTAASQTITGNLAIVGGFTISGNTSIVNAENLRVSDPLIYLAGNNYSSDIVDIGFIANYVNATGQNVHTGLYREHETKEYYLFQGYDREPINNHVGAFSNNMTLAVLNTDIKTSNIILGGVNAISTIGASFNHANAAHASANAGMAIANAAFNRANTANITADRAWNHANASYAFANSAHSVANLAFTHANGAFAKANAALANTAGISTAGSLIVPGVLVANSGGGTVQIRAGGTSDHTYIEYYPRSNTGSRGAYVGYGSAATNTFTIMNETTTGSLQLGTASAVDLTIDSSGRVGIGTTAPSNTFHVVGTANISGTLKSAGLYDSTNRLLLIKDSTGAVVWGN